MGPPAGPTVPPRRALRIQLPLQLRGWYGQQSSNWDFVEDGKPGQGSQSKRIAHSGNDVECPAGARSAEESVCFCCAPAGAPIFAGRMGRGLSSPNQDAGHVRRGAAGRMSRRTLSGAPPRPESGKSSLVHNRTGGLGFWATQPPGAKRMVSCVVRYSATKIDFVRAGTTGRKGEGKTARQPHVSRGMLQIPP